MSLDQNILTDEEIQTILEERASTLSIASDGLDEHEVEDVVIFRASESRYGAQLSVLREIRVVESIARIPCSPDFVLGLIQVHGEVTAVIDLVGFFGARRTEPLPTPTTVLVLEAGGQTIGLACDELFDVEPLPQSLAAPPAALNRNELDVTLGLAGETLILDAASIITHPRLRA